MSAVCPNGHTSESEDYCDTCGSPIDLSAQPAPSTSAAGIAGRDHALGIAGWHRRPRALVARPRPGTGVDGSCGVRPDG